MRKTVSVILLALLLLSFCLTACTPETPKDPDPVPSSGQEKDPEEEPSGDYVIVSPSSKLAYKKACEAAEYELTEIVHHSDMHLKRFLLPCNKQFHERIVYAIDLMKELTKDYPVVVYTASTYGNHDYMEGTWQEVRKMNAGAISTGWMKDGGWYQRNISQKQGEDFVKDRLAEYDDDEKKVWDTNIFGRSLKDIISEDMARKPYAMPAEVRKKMRRAVGRIVNEGRGGIICILL